MKLLNIAVSILLIPTLVAGEPQLSHDAKALLKKSRVGYSDITWRDGTHENVEVLRVTDSFIAVRQSGTCRNVDLSRIAKVDWGLSGGGNDLAASYVGGFVAAVVSVPFLLVLIPVSIADGDINRRDALTALLLIPLAPFYFLWYPIGETKNAIVSHRASQDAKLGTWESSSNNSVERIKLTNTGPNLFQIEEQLSTIRPGTYRFDQGKLYLRYDDDKDREVAVSGRFECDNFVSNDTKAFPTLHALRSEGRAQSPIVGRWAAWYAPGPSAWEFSADGTFRAEKTLNSRTGSFKKGQDTVKIVLNAQQNEDWNIGMPNGNLLVTRAGQTTGFKRRPSVH
jgi:hypothetical protein